MYDLATLKLTAPLGLFGIVGWRQPLEADNDIITGDLLTSETDRFFQGAHPLVTISNLRAVAIEAISVDESDFNTWLTNFTQDSLGNMVDRVFQKKKPQVKNILDKKWLYDLRNTKVDTLDNTTDRLVGFEFNPAKNNNIKIVIDQLGSEFDSVIGPFDVKLWHSSQKSAPIATFELTTTAFDSKFDALSDFIMTYINDYVGGTYYITYEQNDLGSTLALNRNFENNNLRNSIQHLNIRPFYVDDYTSSELFDVRDQVYTEDSYGLNFEVTVQPDLTNFLIEKRELFARMFYYQVAIDVILLIKFHAERNNDIEKRIAVLSTLDIEGTDERPEVGIQGKFDRALEEADFDFSALDDLFYPVRDRFSFTDL